MQVTRRELLKGAAALGVAGALPQALPGYADQNIPFSVKGKTTYEQQMAAIRDPASSSVQ